jgi:hypothetical protein
MLPNDRRGRVIAFPGALLGLPDRGMVRVLVAEDDSDDATPMRRGQVVPPGGRVSVPLMVLDHRPGRTAAGADYDLIAGERTMSATLTIHDVMIQDAAGNLGRAVAGLPPEEAARIVGDAVRIAVLRASDARMRGPESPNGSWRNAPNGAAP